MIGFKPDELPAGYDTWVSLLHPDDLEKTLESIWHNLKDTNEGYDVEFRIKTQSGEFIWILGRGRIIEWDDANNPLILVGSHINIDKQKRAEQKLETYQKQLQDMVMPKVDGGKAFDYIHRSHPPRYTDSSLQRLHH